MLVRTESKINYKCTVMILFKIENSNFHVVLKIN